MPTKTQREREAEQRAARLERMKEQVDAGSLVIRKMTDAERERFAKHSKRNEASRRSAATPPHARAAPRGRCRRSRAAERLRRARRRERHDVSLHELPDGSPAPSAC